MYASTLESLCRRLVGPSSQLGLLSRGGATPSAFAPVESRYDRERRVVERNFPYGTRYMEVGGVGGWLAIPG